jgi:predicted nucleic acid-binding Zn ribbon protein
MKKKRQRRTDSSLEPIEQVIKEVFSDGKFGGSAKASELWSCWKEIVGEDVARHCFPEKVSGGKLYIKADSPIWRQQLDLLKEDIREKIHEKLADFEIDQLVMR